MMDSPASRRSTSTSKALDPLDTTMSQDQPRSTSSPTTRPVDITTRRIGSGGSLRSRRGYSGSRGSIPYDQYFDSLASHEDSFYIADRVPGSPNGPCLILRSPRTSMQRNASASSLGADDLHLSDSYSYSDSNGIGAGGDNSVASNSPRSPSTPTTTFTVDEKTGQEYVEHALPIVECPKDVHVALLDRPLEMKELLEFNSRIASTIKIAMGDTTYAKAVTLWCQTRRDKMSDLEWLCRSKLLFKEGGAGYLWTEWSHMVGYENDLDLDFDPDLMHQRQMPLDEIIEEEE